MIGIINLFALLGLQGVRVYFMYTDDEKYIVSGPFTIDILKCDEVEESAKLLKHYFILAGSVPCIKEARVVRSGQLVDNKAWLPISKED